MAALTSQKVIGLLTILVSGIDPRPLRSRPKIQSPPQIEVALHLMGISAPGNLVSEQKKASAGPEAHPSWDACQECQQRAAQGAMWNQGDIKVAISHPLHHSPEC